MDLSACFVLWLSCPGVGVKLEDKSHRSVSCTVMQKHSASGFCILMLHLDVSGILSVFIFVHCVVRNVTILCAL